MAVVDLEAAIRRAGYEPRRLEEGTAHEDWEREARERESNALRRSLLTAAVLTVPVFVLEMGSHLFDAVHMFVMNTIGMQTSWWIQFVLTSIVLFGPGLRCHPHHQTNRATSWCVRRPPPTGRGSTICDGAP